MNKSIQMIPAHRLRIGQSLLGLRSYRSRHASPRRSQPLMFEALEGRRVLSLLGEGVVNDGQTSLVYDADTGELSLDPPAGIELSSIAIFSDNCSFMRETPQMPEGGERACPPTHTNQIIRDGESFGTVSFGHVLPLALTPNEITVDLSVTGLLTNGAELGNVDLVYQCTPLVVEGIDLTGRDLRRTCFKDLILKDAVFDRANVQGAVFTKANLQDADFRVTYSRDTHFAGAALRGADFSYSSVLGASFRDTTGNGFNKEQLYSTLSYINGELPGVDLSENELAGWSFAGRDLTDAEFASSNLTGASFVGAILTGARFLSADLAGADFSGAIVEGADFSGARGFTAQQLYSTASYQSKILPGIRLADIDLSGWDFSAQDLSDAYFDRAQLTNADFSHANLTDASFTQANFSGTDLTGADLRGAISFSPGPSTRTENMIGATGMIDVDLASGDRFVIRTHPIPIRVNETFAIAEGATLEMILDDAPWTSTITVEANVRPQLGGTLEISFDAGTNITSFADTSFDLFDWNGVLDTGARFEHVQFPMGTIWDQERLYQTGQITLIGVFEPGDADMDFDFDQLDLVQVQIAGKYLAGERATWEEGDWNGDGFFNQLDIVAALQTSKYLIGPHAALSHVAWVK